MDHLDRTQVDNLVRTCGYPCISMFLPTYPAGSDARAPAIRLKNLIRACEKRLKADGMHPDQVSSILEPVADLLNVSSFWSRQSRGLAVFRSPDIFEHYRLPLDFEDYLSIDDRFVVKPLVPLLSNDGRFYILALSLHQARLYEATRQSIEHRPIQDMPDGIQDIVKFEDAEEQLQYHTTPRGTSAGSAAIFHGQGNIADRTGHKKDIHEYLKAVDKAVMHRIAKYQSAPMVLAGVDYIRAAYAEESDYNNILEAGIDGNPDRTREEQLHESAWKLVEPEFHRALNSKLEQYGHAPDNRTSEDLCTILEEAHRGRVEILFAGIGRNVSGRFDPDKKICEIHETFDPQEQDLINRTVLDTLAHGGTVYSLNEDDMPHHAQQAALFRY